MTLEAQFKEFVNQTVAILHDMLVGRPWYGSPDFRHLNVGIDFSPSPIFASNTYNIKYVYPRNYSVIFITRYEASTANFSFRFSDHVFGILSGVMLTATDKIYYGGGIVMDFGDQITYENKLRSIFGYSPVDGGSYYDSIRSVVNKDHYARYNWNELYIGGGLGYRIWRFRAGATVLVPKWFIVSETHNNLFPTYLINGTMDIYMVYNFFLGLNYLYANGAGIVADNLPDIYPSGGVPSTGLGKGVGVKRRNIYGLITVRIGYEF